jgi:hypothetical protein
MGASGSSRTALLLAVGLVGAAASSSCASESPSYEDCDYVLRRCRTVCDYWCDSYGCYPVCYDHCWADCYRNPPEPPPLAGGPLDGGATPPVPEGGGPGVLCSPCVANEDCHAGALCIVRGGDAAASGFCGHPCQSTSECPEGFACGTIGASRQCLPIGDVCR